MAFFAFKSNQQSHPFWDFVAGVDNGSPGMRRPPSYAPRDQYEREQANENTTSAQEQTNNYRVPSVEDETMNDADARPSKRDMVDTEKPSEKDNRAREPERPGWSSDEDRRGGRHGRRGGPRGMHRHGPRGFGPFGFHPFYGPDFGGADFSDWTPHHHGPHHHHHGPPPPQPPPPAGEPPFPPPPPEFGRHWRHARRGGACGRRSGRRGGESFNVQDFLSRLGARLGIDLNAAAGSLGIDLSRAFPGAATGNSDIDFVPSHDLFDLPSEYLVHVSLPGARKEDIGLDFDGEHHTLRVGGVVYRPDVDEQTNSALVQSGRTREVGVFETKVRLPSQDNNDVEIDAANISAKLRDGVLVVRVPKIQKKKDEKRTIRIDTPTPSPERSPSNNLPVREKEPVNGKGKANQASSERDMYEATPAVTSPGTEKGDAYDEKEKEQGEDEIMHEDPPETLPSYTPTAPPAPETHADPHGDAKRYDVSDLEDDEEEEEEEEEGEYVKINVD